MQELPTRLMNCPDQEITKVMNSSKTIYSFNIGCPAGSSLGWVRCPASMYNVQMRE